MKKLLTSNPTRILAHGMILKKGKNIIEAEEIKMIRTFGEHKNK